MDKKGSIFKLSALHYLAVIAVFVSPFIEYFINGPTWQMALIMAAYAAVPYPAYRVWKKLGDLFAEKAFVIAPGLKVLPASTFCLIESNYVQTKTLADRVYVAIVRSVTPVIFTFFILSTAISSIEEGTLVDKGIVVLAVVLVSPIIAGFLVPLRIILDSSLVKYKLERRMIEPFGIMFYRSFKSMLSLGVIVSYVMSSLSRGSFIDVAFDLATIFFFVFPTIVAVNIIYEPALRESVNSINSQLKKTKLKEYTISLVPVERVEEDEKKKAGDDEEKEMEKSSEDKDAEE